VPDSALSKSYIATPEALAALLTRIPSGPGVRCAIDTEADSLHSYKEKLCLIQLACGEEKVIIDPLSIPDLSPLVKWLTEVEIWMHGADFDMTLMKRTFDVIPERIFDTQAAARLAGEKQFGLAHLVESVFGVVLSKQSQRADWGKRPLSEKMIEYALNDVHYIFELADLYVGKLRALGREEWFLETCRDARETVLHRPGADPDQQWRITGSGKLRPCGLNYLRAIWQWRDGEAQRLDRPAFKVTGNVDLLNWAEALENGGDADLHSRFPPPIHRRFHKAIRDAREADHSTWPQRPPRLRYERNPEAEKQFEILKAKRDQLGKELDIDPSLIGSRSALEAICFQPDRVPELFLNWQRKLLGI
jgi:ribonuclease D